MTFLKIFFTREHEFCWNLEIFLEVVQDTTFQTNIFIPRDIVFSHGDKRVKVGLHVTFPDDFAIFHLPVYHSITAEKIPWDLGLWQNRTTLWKYYISVVLWDKSCINAWLCVKGIFGKKNEKQLLTTYANKHTHTHIILSVYQAKLFCIQKD